MRDLEIIYSKEEVVYLCLKIQHEYSDFKNINLEASCRKIAEWTDNWLEDNL